MTRDQPPLDIDTKGICFADSAMIMHVVPESAEVSSCGLRNISQVMYMAPRGCNAYAGERRSFFMRLPEYIARCLYKIYGGARVKKIADVRTIYTYIYRLRTFYVGLAQARPNYIWYVRHPRAAFVHKPL